MERGGFPGFTQQANDGCPVPVARLSAACVVSFVVLAIIPASLLAEDPAGFLSGQRLVRCRHGAGELNPGYLLHHVTAVIHLALQ
jgi:hypothetical protein